jgi:hypothetical protein
MAICIMREHSRNTPCVCISLPPVCKVQATVLRVRVEEQSSPTSRSQQRFSWRHHAIKTHLITILSAHRGTPQIRYRHECTIRTLMQSCRRRASTPLPQLDVLRRSDHSDINVKSMRVSMHNNGPRHLFKLPGCSAIDPN